MKRFIHSCGSPFATIVILPLVVAALVLVVAPSRASACGGGGEGHRNKHACPFALDGVNVTGEDLSNGARLTLTSDDDESVEVIQSWAERHAKGAGCSCHAMKGAKVSATMLSDGAQLTFTSDDDVIVARIQHMVHRKAAGHGCEHGGHGACEHRGCSD